MDVKKEFIRLKEQWMNSKGEAREKADVEMQAFFDSLTEKDKKLIAEAVDEDFSKIHQKIEDCKNLSHRIEVRTVGGGITLYFHIKVCGGLFREICILASSAY